MLGSHLRETERLALYKFFLSSKRDQFISDAKKLIEFSELNREIANGEIHYAIKGDLLTYSARKKGDLVYLENLRTIKLSKITKFRTRKIMKFFHNAKLMLYGTIQFQVVSQKRMEISALSLSHTSTCVTTRPVGAEFVAFSRKYKLMTLKFLSNLEPLKYLSSYFY